MDNTDTKKQEAIYNHNDVKNKIRTLSVEQLQALSLEIDAIIWDNYYKDKSEAEVSK